jgi:7-keto-8-aminopelargonate synthetase-like enzyme
MIWTILETRAKKHAQETVIRTKMVIIDGVYSQDGDVAPNETRLQK